MVPGATKIIKKDPFFQFFQPEVPRGPLGMTHDTDSLLVTKKNRYISGLSINIPFYNDFPAFKCLKFLISLLPDATKDAQGRAPKMAKIPQIQNEIFFEFL